MKSYILEGVTSPGEVRFILDRLLPGQRDPWLLRETDGDPIAYYALVEADVELKRSAVVANISGRHYDQDERVVAILQRLQAAVGGEITYAP